MTEAMAVLRKMFGSDIPDAIDIVVPDWIDDPLTYGSFTAWPTGYEWLITLKRARCSVFRLNALASTCTFPCQYDNAKGLPAYTNYLVVMFFSRGD